MTKINLYGIIATAAAATFLVAAWAESEEADRVRPPHPHTCTTATPGVTAYRAIDSKGAWFCMLIDEENNHFKRYHYLNPHVLQRINHV